MNSNNFQFNEHDMQTLFEQNLPDETVPADLSERLLNTILTEAEQVYAPPVSLHQRAANWFSGLFQNRWIVPASTAAAVAAVLLLVVVMQFTWLQGPSVTIVAQGGNVEVLRTSGRQILVRDGRELVVFEGDVIVTQSGVAVMDWQEDQQIRAASNTRLTFLELDTLNEGTQLETFIDRGKIFADINRELEPQRDSFVARTPNSYFSVVGTEFVVRVDVNSVGSETSAEEISTTLTVREGEVTARVVSDDDTPDDVPEGEEIPVPANRMLTVSGDDQPVVESVTDEQIAQELIDVELPVVVQEDTPNSLMDNEVIVEEGAEDDQPSETAEIVSTNEPFSEPTEPSESELPTDTTEIGVNIPEAAPTPTSTSIRPSPTTPPIASIDEDNVTPGEEAAEPPSRATGGISPTIIATAVPVGTPVEATSPSPTVGASIEPDTAVILPGPTATMTPAGIMVPTATPVPTSTPTSTATPLFARPTSTATSTPRPTQPPTATTVPTATPTPTSTPEQDNSPIVLPTADPDSPLPLPTAAPTSTEPPEDDDGDD